MAVTEGGEGEVAGQEVHRAGALRTGMPAPRFALPDADMDMFELAAALRDHVIVLVFYPRDGTPGCTRQAIAFSDHDADFSAAGAIVVGVSPDDVLTHAAFRDEHGLSMRLLSDPDFEVCRAYGVLACDAASGRQSVNRATFIVDRNGIIRHALHTISARGHVAEVLALIRQIPRN